MDHIASGRPLLRGDRLAGALPKSWGGRRSPSQGHMGTPQEQQACRRDAQRFSRQQLGDDGAVQQCLQQNRTRLSKSCQKVFASHGM
ncbi:hypothetical protein [Bradyrhizobium sp. AZCC 1577]|uniref:hypothetical protein n=1 Tax=Bradyrhizobium sp. AZCC 1577 TaxID=3117019 RepID=UPI003FA5EDA8